MNESILFRLSGTAAILAGLAYFADTLLDIVAPGNRYGIGLLVPLFGLYGLTGMFAYQRKAGGMLGLIGYACNFAGLAALIAVVFTNNLVLPGLAPEIVKGLLAGPVVAVFIAAGSTYLVGALVFGVALWRSAVFSRWAVSLYVLGSVPVALPPVFNMHIVTIGGLLVGASLIWFGLQLVARSNTGHAGVSLPEPHAL